MVKRDGAELLLHRDGMLPTAVRVASSNNRDLHRSECITENFEDVTDNEEERVGLHFAIIYRGI
jgi:hypothetical protein